jgi:hypothetical protein
VHERQAIDVRHHEVLQDQGGPDALGRGFGFRSPLTAVELEARLAVEQAREGQADEPLVVDQQNRRVRARRRRGGVHRTGHDSRM